MEMIISMNLLKLTKDTPSQSWSTKVQCLCYVDKVLTINNIKIKVGFRATVENVILNEIALDQMEMFFDLLMHNSIIIDKAVYDKIDEFPFINNIFMVPGNISDQVIGSLVFVKLVSIVKNNLEIDYITISTELGKKIKYTITGDSPEIEVLLPKKVDWWDDENVMFDPWWLRSDTATYDFLINRDEIYEGEFIWEEFFKEELSKLKEETESPRRKAFKIIEGGKDAT